MPPVNPPQDPDTAPAGAATPSPEWARAKAAYEALQGELKDHQLRSLAELDNVRKRAAREAAQSAKFGAEKLLRELLAVVDSLELALKAGAGGSAQAILEGVELTHRQFLKTLEKHGVSVVDPTGQVFDPALHEAVAVIESTDVAANHVVEVMQTGYCLHDRLLRPARVVVAKAPAGSAGPAS
ncbi:MAG: nucleotide exchange factor GrpE [Nevskiaceae bacterium]|nr:MAG: nucleotide exchange factor GrpE [Nevskiaceae bacterium]TBR71581.1 MAG: nucleotide exchange factor GrpE [Nevskiaceae bacterium]